MFVKVPIRALAAVLLLVAAGQLAGREDATPPDATQQIFRDTVGVEVVSVDVVVTDRKGRLVEGLTAEDFELLVDGRPAEITNFYAVAGRTSEGTTLPTRPPETPAEASPEAPPASPPEDVHVVVFLDNFATSPAGRKRLLADLPELLERQLDAGHRVMVIASDRGSAEILTSFTNSREDVERALARADELVASGLFRRVERRRVLADIIDMLDSCPIPNLDREPGDGRRGEPQDSAGPLEDQLAEKCAHCYPRLLSHAESYSVDVDTQRRARLATLNNVVSALGALEGRKNLLYVSDGMPQQSGIDVFHYVQELCPSEVSTASYDMRFDSQSGFDDLVEHANANRVTFYSIEAAGLQGISGHDASWGDVSETSAQGVPSAMNDRVRIANTQSGLFYMANETGGKAVLNANHFADDFVRIDEETSHYYSLGFVPGHAPAGRSHRITVRLPDNKKAELRYRRSFLHKDRDRQLAERALGAYLFGVEKNPLAATVSTGTPSAAGEGRVFLPVEVRVPVDHLTLLPGAKDRQGRVTLIVAAPDKRGQRAEIRKKELTVRAPLAGAGDGPADYLLGVQLELQPGEHELAIGVWDEVAETASFLRLTVTAELPAV